MTAASRSPAPVVELEDPGGRRVMVAPRSPEDRVGELADALGVDPRCPLRLDGRPVGRHETLTGAGLVRGSRLEAADDAALDEPAATTHALVVVEAGPAAGAALTLGPGRHVLGRAASASIPIADPLLEPHHGLLDVGPDGDVAFVQLAGRVPARIAGEPVAGPTAVPAGATVVVGATRLRVGGDGDTAPAAAATTAVLAPASADPWRRTLRRTPRVEPHWSPDPIAVPAAATTATRPSAAGLAATALTLGGSVAVAVVMGSPMFLVIGAAGALASFAFWLAGRVRAARDDRRAGRIGEQDVTAFAGAVTAQREARWRYHVAVTPTLAAAIADATSVGPGVWVRRPDHADAFTATLGWGPVTWNVELGPADMPVGAEIAGLVSAAERFDDAPVPVDLGPGATLAIAGAGARAVVRSLIVQLATWTGPADWRLVVVASDRARWEWCRWLPHAAAGDTTLVVSADDTDLLASALRAVDDHRHVLVVVDRPDPLALRTGAVRRFLGAHPSAAVLVEVPPGDAVPALCRGALEIGSIGLARWRPEISSPAGPGRVHVAGLTEAAATLVARRLAGLHDPEDPSTAGAALPTAVSLSELRERHGAGPVDDAIAIAGTWRSNGPDPPAVAAIGLTGDGVVEIDLARDGPHALVAGTTGSGKSELLRTLVVSLAARSSPDHLTFVLVDYKGGATFDACAELPHTVGLVTDLDERLAERALISLEAELRRRERRLRAAGADDLRAYRAIPGEPPLPRLVVVIDEFAALAAELPGFVSSLVGVAQRGRSLGIHLVLATQRPSGVVDDEIRANTNLRLALRLQHPADGRDVVGDAAPAEFPRGTPGRAMLRLGPDEAVVFQAARSSGPTPRRSDEGLRVVDSDDDDGIDGVSELDVLVRSIRHAAALSDVEPPHRPWLPPLPERIGPGGGDGVDIGPGDAGVLDDPAEQHRRRLRWAPEDGHLALLGAVGSGTTTALLTVVVALVGERPPQRLHVYVIDARGDHRVDELDRLTHCGGVVRPHEGERLARLLRRLTGELDGRRRMGGRGDGPHVVLAIDGIAALRAALDGRAEEIELLNRIVAEGPALGIAGVLAAERPGAIPPAILAGCGERWLFRLDDPAEAGLCGVPAAAVPRGGPGRIVVASNRLEGQVAELAAPSAGPPASGGPPPIGTLSYDVDAAGLPPGRRHGERATELVVGVDFHSLQPATLVVPDGEHVLVAGPPRSGRSTALVRLARSWRDAHPDGTVLAFPTDGVAGAVDAMTPLRPCLLLIDDAERVDDATGALSTLVGERRSGLLVIAAGRPDALRVQYGHWTNVVRRSRLGLLMTACADTDGDVLGEVLPRRPPLPPRPGLAWVVGTGPRALVQVGRTDVIAFPGHAGRR
jgi:S-DNA-T family DNA segregation ATPase FtsK/SpoIIIE